MIAPDARDVDWRLYAGVAVFLVGLAWSAMRWVGRTIREDLDTGLKTGPRKSLAMQAQTDLVPPALVKRALERGLVTSSQLATMSATERQFFFASLKSKLDAPGDSGTPARGSTSVATPVRPSAAVSAMSGAAFGMASLPESAELRVHCAACGAPLKLPAFPPFVAHCDQCGVKTAVRQEDGGRMVLTVSPKVPGK